MQQSQEEVEKMDEPLLSYKGSIPSPTNVESKKPNQRGVNTFQLMMMIYFNTSGGPFGIESAVGGGGPLLTLISFIVVPLIWSVPQSLMAAELSLLISENGGNVIWVQQAFGDFLGWWNAYSNVLCNFSSLACLVVLFVNYLPFKFFEYQRWLIKIGFILLNIVINILGIEWVSRLSVVFIIFIFSPFIAEVVLLGLRHEFDFKAVAYIPPLNEIKWGVFLSTVIWSYGGFDSIGSFAGEVSGGKNTFLKGVLASLPLIFINYLFPILFGYSIDPNWQNWTDGYFTKLAYDLTNWLGIWMLTASAVSNFGQVVASIATQARTIWAMAKAEGTAQMLPGFLSWSWQGKKGASQPVAAIIFTGVVITALTALPFDFLVEVFLIVRVFNLFCEYAALIRLKYKRPEIRKYSVPGGKVGAYLLGVPSVFLAAYTIAEAGWKVWVTGAVCHAVIVIAFLIKYGIQKLIEWQKSRHRKQHSQQGDPEEKENLI